MQGKNRGYAVVHHQDVHVDRGELSRLIEGVLYNGGSISFPEQGHCVVGIPVDKIGKQRGPLVTISMQELDGYVTFRYKIGVVKHSQIYREALRSFEGALRDGSDVVYAMHNEDSARMPLIIEF
ncbi:MAG: hypothetical protein HY364_04475 [Candidatus Aenigmarchaeota archaeon]|nr:hypothetical protein [Candidatus Aenigmarchaeota archaeon]